MRGYTVYRLYGADERLLYVGLTGNGENRLVAHARGRSWWNEVAYIHLEHFSDGREARDYERFLIEELHPPHNVRFRVPDGSKRDVPEPVRAAA